MTTAQQPEIWFLTGSQGLYGEDVLRQVADQSRAVSDRLAESADVPAAVVAKPVLTDSGRDVGGGGEPVRHRAGLVGDLAEDVLAVEALAPGEEPDLRLLCGGHERLPGVEVDCWP